MIDVDAQPNYVRATVKHKIFQLALNDEIRLSATTSKRSQITGHLLITMPKLSIDQANPNALSEKNIGTTEPGKYFTVHACKSFKIVIIIIINIILIHD